MLEDIFDDVYEGQGTRHVNSFAAKLDRLMVLICQHLKSCAENGLLFEVFETLLKSFYVSVLKTHRPKTHRPKSSQFFMLYACSLDPKKCGLSFVVMLADDFLDNTGIALSRKYKTATPSTDAEIRNSP